MEGSMANWLANLFARSPFGPIQEHQHKVEECAELAPQIIEACLRGDHQRVMAFAKQMSHLEGEADVIKNRVRDQLPRSLFMPVSRGDILNVLAAQDDIADCAEDLGVLLSMRQMEPLPDDVGQLLRELTEACTHVVRQSTEVVDQLGVLVQSSFSGPEAQRVITLIDELGTMEHEADKIQDQLAKAFFAREDDFKPAAIYLWMKIFNKVGDLANFAEKMTHRIRLFMAK
jgi:predicted phosphate transport protein (TIGR00153 family)